MKLFAVLSLFISLMVGSAYGETLRVGTSADFPPWSYTNPSGDIVGFERDMGDEICKRIGAQCTWTNQAYDGLIPSLLIGKFDLIISGASITDERKKRIDFSIPYADAPYQFAAPAGSPLESAKTREDIEKALSNKIVGVQSGTTHDIVMRHHFNNVDVRRYQRNEQIADDLVLGRLDAGLLELSVWQALMKNRDGQLILVGPLLSGADYPEFGQGIAIGLKKGRSALKQRVDDAIKAMLADGTITTLSEKYFGYDVSFKGKSE